MYNKYPHKIYLKTAQKKTKKKKEIRRAVGRQLRFLKSNLGHIDFMLEGFNPAGVRIKDIKALPLDIHQHKYLLVIRTVHDQQRSMYNDNIHQTDHRIVSIHQPHVGPIVRGKTVAKTAYGMNRIKSRLARTSESWVASIIMVLNLVKLAGQVPFYLWPAIQGWYFREGRTRDNFFILFFCYYSGQR